MKFRVGDKVLVKGSRSISGKKLTGQICVIEEIYPLHKHGGGYATLDKETMIAGTKDGVWLDELELAKPRGPYLSNQGTEAWY